MENEPLLLPWRLNNLADNMEIKHLSWHGDGNTLIPKESTSLWLTEHNTSATTLWSISLTPPPSQTTNTPLGFTHTSAVHTFGSHTPQTTHLHMYTYTHEPYTTPLTGMIDTYMYVRKHKHYQIRCMQNWILFHFHVVLQLRIAIEPHENHTSYRFADWKLFTKVVTPVTIQIRYLCNGKTWPSANTKT